MAEKPSPDTTQPVEDSQILSASRAASSGQPPPLPDPRDPDVSGWLGLPVASDEFAPATRPARQGRGKRLLVFFVGGLVAVGAATATGFVAWSPRSAPAPMPPPAPPAPPAAPAPAVAGPPALAAPPVVDSPPATTEEQKIAPPPAPKKKKGAHAKKRASAHP